jgi:hypothetical protein
VPAADDDAMLIILTITFALFHYWRFQDAATPAWSDSSDSYPMKPSYENVRTVQSPRPIRRGRDGAVTGRGIGVQSLGRDTQG